MELRARSAFSFDDGVLAPEAVAETAVALGYDTVALCDTADLGGAVRFALAAERQGLRPLVGGALRVDDAEVVLLPTGPQGWRHLVTLVTRARLLAPRGRPAVAFANVAARADDLLALVGGPLGPVARAWRAGGPAAARRALARWREAFGDRLAVDLHLHPSGPLAAATQGALRTAAEALGVLWTVAHEPRYRDAAGRLAHDLRTALRLGLPYALALRRGRLRPHGDWTWRRPAEIALRARGLEAGLDASRALAERAAFHLAWLRPPLPRFPVADEDAFLRARVEEGARERWGRLTDRHRARLEHELAVIRRLGYAGFFLLMWEICREARARGILCQGRGSAANSAVAYCLGITAIDPVRHGLLFERFLSEARADGGTEAPDIDVDFEAHRREEMLAYVYARYGRERAALTATTQLYHGPSAAADLLRALGYPPAQVRAITRRLRGLGPADAAQALRQGEAARAGLALGDPRARALLRALPALEGVPRLRGTHPGGFVLAGADLGAHLPLEPTAAGRTIVQFDKDDLDALGVPKFDLLGLGALSAVRHAFDAVATTGVPRPELHRLPPDDPAVFRLLQTGETIGTFQVESRAQIQSLVQTRPERMYDLVVQVALIRPGPIQAEFVHPYVRRRRGWEPVVYRHPALAPILERTLGIPIFQEQAMRIAIDLAGYTPAEADALRRCLGHARRPEALAAATAELRRRLVAAGLAPEVAEGIAADLKVFSAYGFPESHAWSFALIAYATLWLKAHHPAALLVGLLEAQPMGFYPPSTLVHDARRHGVEVRPPCLVHGTARTRLEAGADGRPAVRLGWRWVRGVSAAALQRLEAARAAQPFRDVADAVRRARLARDEALQLARAGAFEALEPGRRAAAWAALGAAAARWPLAPADDLPFPRHEPTPEERIFLDYLATGVCVDGHPVAVLRPRLRAVGAAPATELRALRPGAPVLAAGLVVARQRPPTARGTAFLLLEDETGHVDVVVPAPLAERQRDALRFAPFLLVEGRLEGAEGAWVGVVARRLRPLGTPPLAHRSRDFH